MKALTEDERDAFDAIREVLGLDYDPDQHIGPCLVRSAIGDIDVALIAVSTIEDDGDYTITPLAIMLNDDLFEMLTNPEEGLS